MAKTDPIHHYITFIIILKFSFLAVLIAYYVAKYNNNSQLIIDRLSDAKTQLETLFVILTTTVLLFYFAPGSTNKLEKDGEFLFFLFAIIILITADWKSFIVDSWFYKKIKQLI